MGKKNLFSRQFNADRNRVWLRILRAIFLTNKVRVTERSLRKSVGQKGGVFVTGIENIVNKTHFNKMQPRIEECSSTVPIKDGSALIFSNSSIEKTKTQFVKKKKWLPVMAELDKDTVVRT